MVNLSAKTMSYVLMGVIGLVFVITIGGAWFLHDKLSSTIDSAKQVSLKAAANDTTIASAQALKIYLEKNKADVSSAAKVVADASSYKYQNQIVEELTGYANASNVIILGFDFPTNSAPKKSTDTTLKSVSVTITLQDPVRYVDYLRFLKYIEQNITKMQVTEINMSPDSLNPQLINSSIISLEVYIK